MLEELVLGDPVHEVAELEEDKVDVGQVISAQIRLLAEELDEGGNFVHDDLRDGRSVASLVAWHRGSALQVVDLSRNHLHLSDLGRSGAEQVIPILVADKLHDRTNVRQARFAINEVRQIGES